uniref:uncharacterized protein LOC120335592 n=1 Tax=Styela clava TaxID=7725 RepID=UPI0019392894|nr:uncharacterized protein LOC120335592 [Styela clava]
MVGTGMVYDFQASSVNKDGYHFSTNVSVTVKAYASIVRIEPPTLAIPTKPENNTVKCFAMGYPKPVINWYRGNVTVSNITTPGIYQTNHSDHTTLHVVKQDKTSIGEYTCVATNIVDEHVKHAVATIQITDQCTPKPCKNDGQCTQTTHFPFFNCTCLPPYNGSRCENEVFFERGVCKYHINYNHKMNFLTANESCGKLEGILAILKVQKIQIFVENQVQALYNNVGLIELWIGGHKNEKKWIWFDGSSINSDTDSNWAPGRPGNNIALALSSWLSIKGNMSRTWDKLHWFDKTNTSNIGYVCEVAVSDPCVSNESRPVCQNGGMCIRKGCQRKCMCNAGYDGEHCDNDRINMATTSRNYVTEINRRITVTLNVDSNHGLIKVECFQNLNFSYSFQTKRNVSNNVSITIGPFSSQSFQTSYTFRARPEIDPESYFREENITVVVEAPARIKYMSSSSEIIPNSMQNITCEATGVPRPQIKWYKGNKEVSSEVSQTVFQSNTSTMAILHLKNALRKDAGVYACVARNVVGGRMEVYENTSILRAEILLKGNNISENNNFATAMCAFEGYPIPKIHWMFSKNGTNLAIKQEVGSIFKTSSTNSTQDVAINTSKLDIALFEYLGMTNISCYASNSFENTSTATMILNRNLAVGSNSTYIVIDNMSARANYTTAKDHCSSIGGSLTKINNNETQLLIKSLADYRKTPVSLFIGAKRSRNDGVWRWIDEEIMFNEGRNESWDTNSNNSNDNFEAWAEGQSNKQNTNCVTMRHPSWKWYATNCSESNGFVCQRGVIGKPTQMTTIVEQCSANITVSWRPAIEAIGIKHTLELIKDDADRIKAVAPEVVIPTNSDNIYRRLSNLEHSTVYQVKITVCSDICTHPSVTTSTVRTDATLPDPVNQLRVIMLKNSKTCHLSWKANNTDGITAFKITSQAKIAQVASTTYAQWSMTEEFDTSSDDFSKNITVGLNMNYTFTVRAKTCAGLGQPVVIENGCVTEQGPPASILPPTIQIPSNGLAEVSIPAPDESHGPITCFYIILIYKPDANHTNLDYRHEQLLVAMEKAKSKKLLNNDAYIAIAITRSDVASKIDKNETFTRKLGDESKSSCNLSLPSDLKRVKRSDSNIRFVEGNNRNLENEATFGVQIVTTTYGENGQTYFKTSNTTLFYKKAPTDPEQPGGNSYVAAIVVAIIAVICLAAIVGILFKKKRDTLKKASFDIGMQQLGERTDHAYANFAMDDTEPRSATSIPMDQLLIIYNSMKAKDSQKFRDEFEALKEEAKAIEYSTEIASASALKMKNRYKNILPCDTSRVILRGEGDATYINASYIKGYKKNQKFIASQGPLPNTANDFWRMVTEKNVSVIVMLTNCIEGGRAKCEKYWPDQGVTRMYGDVKLENKNEATYGSFVVRRFALTTESNEEKPVYQYHFIRWPDHGVPVTTTNLIKFYNSVMSQHAKTNKNSPIICHCSAGAGRTGAFIAYDYTLEEAEAKNSIDVYACVLKMREYRVQFVQTCDQYILVHKLLLEWYLMKETDIDQDSVSKVMENKPEIVERLEKEFKNLSLVGPINQTKHGDTSRNRAMNRCKEIVPYERNRVIILKQVNEIDVPYINASVIETYDTTRMFATQGPMKSSIEYFWRCIIDNSINTIIMLTKCTNDKKEQCAQYWPESSEDDITIRNMTISLKQEFVGDIIEREMNISRETYSRKIVQYQYTGWKADKSPCDISSVLELVNKMHENLAQTEASAALVHCSDGAGRTGVFCAIVNLIARVKNENKIDVFRAVKDLRDCRPGMVQTLKQYNFCYEAISSFLTTSNLYCDINDKEEESEDPELHPYSDIDINEVAEVSTDKKK